MCRQLPISWEELCPVDVTVVEQNLTVVGSTQSGTVQHRVEIVFEENVESARGNQNFADAGVKRVGTDLGTTRGAGGVVGKVHCVVENEEETSGELVDECLVDSSNVGFNFEESSDVCSVAHVREISFVTNLSVFYPEIEDFVEIGDVNGGEGVHEKVEVSVVSEESIEATELTCSAAARFLP